MIFLARRVLCVFPPDDQPAALEPLESIRQDVAGDSLRRREELSETTFVVEQQIANDEERPPVADQIERTGDRTSRT
jgi:hypothetical protein